jgi:glycosyltransferase involved in cell wall biosynthesis
MSGVLALTWLEHRRTTELCAGLQIEMVVLDTARRGLLRYFLLGMRTIVLLLGRRPEVLLVQNPSLVLSALSVALRRVVGYRLIVDAHNEAVAPFANRQRWVGRLSRWVIRHADLTVVTNRRLAELVQVQGGRPFTLPDRIPTPRAVRARTLSANFNVVLIATFARDEPIAAVFEAVRGVDNLELYVTGNHRKLDRAIAADLPTNVRFTGFLADEDYWGLLQAADAIVDLSLKADCLVCGAYEAFALAKPMLLSNNRASQELFGGGAVFTDNTAGDIRAALEGLRSDPGRMQMCAARKRDELARAWTIDARRLAATISAWLQKVRSEIA